MRKTAAYDVKAALDTELSIDASSVWCFSDLFEEFHHFQEEFHGGFGLLTSHGIPKPVYHAFRMLREVGGYRLLLGEDATDQEIGTAAFADAEYGEGSLWILLFRQKMRQLDLPAAHVTVEVKADRRPASVTVKKIDETHGNPLAVWQQMKAPVPAMPWQVEQIRQDSAVREEALDFAFEQGRIVFSGALSVTDVWLVRISDSV